MCEEEKLFVTSNQLLLSLSGAITNVRKTLDELETKIDMHGLNGYYSRNSDVLERAVRLHSIEKELSIILEFQRSLTDTQVLGPETSEE